MSTSIIEVRAATNKEWDELWRESANSTYFHSREWAEIWSSYTNGRVQPAPRLVLFSDGAEALLPLSLERVAHGLAKRFLSSPAGTFGGWLSSERLGADHAHLLCDLLGTAYDIPAENASFDCILSTAVLEHLEEPGRALKEAFRVLRPGGHVLYTAPLFWHLHEEPRDFYRYTRYGLEYLFNEAGFQIIRLEALSGFWTTFFTELGYYLQRFRRAPFRPLIDLAVILNNVLAVVFDRGPLRDERFTWMYLVVAKKPDVS